MNGLLASAQPKTPMSANGMFILGLGLGLGLAIELFIKLKLIE